MERWTGEHRGYAIKAYYQNGESLVQTRRDFRRHFNIPRNQPVPSDNAMKMWVNNLEQTGSTYRKRGGSARTIRTPENIERVRQAMLRSPRRSAIRHATRLRISDRSVRRSRIKYRLFNTFTRVIINSVSDFVRLYLPGWKKMMTNLTTCG